MATMDGWEKGDGCNRVRGRRDRNIVTRLMGRNKVKYKNNIFCRVINRLR